MSDQTKQTSDARISDPRLQARLDRESLRERTVAASAMKNSELPVPAESVPKKMYRENGILTSLHAPCIDDDVSKIVDGADVGQFSPVSADEQEDLTRTSSRVNERASWLKRKYPMKPHQRDRMAWLE